MDDECTTRFWRYVNKTDGCWVWIGGRRNGRYGDFAVGHPNKHMLAHRFSWTLHNGPVPTGLHVLHKCDNPPCVNPDHLFLGTAADNARDKVSKGRQSRVQGERHHNAKLCVSKVQDIRRECATGTTQREAAKKYGVSQRLVYMVVHKQIWSHVP